MYIYTGVYGPNTIDTPHDRVGNGAGDSTVQGSHIFCRRPLDYSWLQISIELVLGRLQHPFSFHATLPMADFDKLRDLKQVII